MFTTKSLFSSQVLKSAKLYNLTLTGVKNKEILLELPEQNVLYNYTQHYLDNVLENRFWLYDNLSSIEGRRYSFRFKGRDSFQKNLVFNSKTYRLNPSTSVSHICNMRAYLLDKQQEKSLLRSRMVFLDKHGFNILFFGLQVPLLSNFPKYNKKFPYSSWFILMLNYIGVLTYFSLVNWKISKRMRYSTSNITNKASFYYRKRAIIKSVLHIDKNLINNE